ncbi:MAG: dienelactone hydrolase family protein [Verrucomicrobiota bacterium]|nr:dienelactone hydrolase family protein [Verrucomicrobiota bacterium]
MKVSNLFLAFSLFGLIAASQAAPLRVEKQQEEFVSGGRRIRVETFAPAGSVRLPAVLVLHSAAGTLIGKGELERFCRTLAEQGTIAFFVHYFDRTGTIFAGDKAIDQYSRVWTDTIKDAVDFAAVHPRVRHEAIGIFGYSLGAFVAVAEASRDLRVVAVVEVAGGIFKGFSNQMRRLPPIAILHGSADKRVPVVRASELEKRARQFGVKPEMKIYPGEGHRLSRAASQDASRRALNFFKEHL